CPTLFCSPSPAVSAFCPPYAFFDILWTLRRGDLVVARSLVSAEPSPHDEGFKGKRKGCKGWGRSHPWTSKRHRSRTWCKSRARTTHLPSRSRVPTTKGSKENEKDVRDGEDRSRR